LKRLNHNKVTAILKPHNRRFRQNSHLLAAIQFNAMSFKLQIVITMTINTCEPQSALHKQEIWSPQCFILSVMMHVMY